MEEIWKDVVGYEGQYQVSSMGRVRSKDVKYNGKNGREINLKGKIRSLSMAGHYLKVSLKIKGTERTINVHVLVGEAFIGIRKEGEHFDHIDNNKLNNRADNLRIVTRRQNIMRAARGKSKYPGVFYRAACTERPWYAALQINKKREHLGSFESEELAYIAYRNKLKLHKPEALKYFEQENNIVI